MVLFVTFILLGLTLGVGTMLAPALPTRHPRIAASGVLVLALVLSGSVFLGALFGWNTLVVDYLWFAVIIAIFLGGTLTIGMHRIEEALARGQAALAGWPGPCTLLAFFGWLVVILIIVLALPTPSNYRTLPPTVDFQTGNLGVVLLITYFDTQLPATSDHVYQGLLVLITLALTWLLYDISNEIEAHETVGWGLTLAAPLMLAGFDVVLLLATLFSLNFGFFALRWCREAHQFEGVAAAVCGTAAVLSYPYAAGILACGYLLLGAMTPYRRWLVGLMGITILITLGLLPWLVING